MKTFATVCSGIGAPEVAAASLDWRAVFSSDIEAFPNAVRAHHWADVPNLGDMTKFEEWNDYAIDVLIGGTPCQSFSVAGLRGGLDDARGQLMLTFVDIAARYRPQWLLWENVPGVLSSNGGKDFAALLGALTGTEVCVPAEGWGNAGWLGGIADAYGCAWRVLDAQYFGVAQRRRRVFVVAHIGGLWQRAAAVLFERESLRGDPAPRRETGKRVAPTISARAKGGGGLGTDFDLDGGRISTSTADGLETFGIPGNWIGRKPENGGNAVEPMHNVCPNLPKSDRHAVAAPIESRIQNPESSMEIAHAPRGEGFDASEDGTGRGTPLVPEVFRMTAFGEYSDDGTASSMKQRDYKDATDLVATSMAVRRLTPRECERLQGFPDDFTAIPFRNKPACDGPRYKALGNSMAVPNIRWILARMDLVDATMGNP